MSGIAFPASCVMMAPFGTDPRDSMYPGSATYTWPTLDVLLRACW